METLHAAELLAALGHETRLAIFRLLVEAGPQGRYPNELGEALALPPATLSFHLAHLKRVGLIRRHKEGRFLRYAAAYETMDGLLAFLMRNCCGGATCLSGVATEPDEKLPPTTAPAPQGA
ncbi:ArsR/SmtB family transcription factor [Tepidiphilus baoligensis]|uniref:Metalloregulator ArsR/SmtB family transcription factor n=1 Tax=Tepidiphilus baoligensis TaxID=2698687 RepID=A0ABX1QLZ9_9PROT|nr:metalloregulator ArsR/SmtB family transcription factor [Tepidiphilus baoligensis]NMH16239.1 metalloregulator ArsR/SmtB family transcription factor [Tepidiphilus baoligensis]